MKNNLIIYLLILLIIGCSKSEYEKRIDLCSNNLSKCQLVNSENIRHFQDMCEKLAKCMKANEWYLVYLPNQSHNLYACSIEKKSKKHLKSNFFYPQAKIFLNHVESTDLSEAIETCEFMTETGRFSDKYYDEFQNSIKPKRKGQKYNEFSEPNKPLKIKVQ